jgi:hypothetical protein
MSQRVARVAISEVDYSLSGKPALVAAFTYRYRRGRTLQPLPISLTAAWPPKIIQIKQAHTSS